MARVLRVVLVLLAGLLGACTSTQYAWQAATGHLKVLAAARDIEEVLQDVHTPDRLREQLIHVQAIRTFAVDQLGLPDNASYTRYADLGRPFVVWNVVVSRPDDFALQRWCFPFTGCISYKGFYGEQDARNEALAWRARGMDVAVLGVPAYSTLGFTADPVLNTFVHYPAGELARLIFHELAHQVVYIADDTQFNESFASTVEVLGVDAWLAQPGQEGLADQYRMFDSRRTAFKRLLAAARADLAELYGQQESPTHRLSGKAERLAKLQQDYLALKASWGGWAGYDRFMAEDLNNAKLGVMGLYDDDVPAFKSLFWHCGSHFGDFYRAVAALGRMAPDARREQLSKLAGGRPFDAPALGCGAAKFKHAAPRHSASEADRLQKP
ncbi:MAG TPA: aminopeptidase [Limnobacter sp.]|nr:aminopeptidase [Limnobacter sp.]